jgi:amino acid adenylation domain-containing protein
MSPKTTAQQKIQPAEAAPAFDVAALLALGRGPEPVLAAIDPLERIRRSASERPEHPAVVAGGQSISYAALALRVGRLATHLRSLGVGPETHVGVCLPRGLDELLCMLATWTAGGAYVPLDASHPPDRIRLILEDAAPRVLLSTRAIARTLEVPAATQIIDLEEATAAVAACAAMPLEAAEPAQLAYVLFTSGSTGRPKGVAIPRGAVANLLCALTRTPGLGPDDRLLAITTTTFDISVLELFLPLCVGATVEIADRGTGLDATLLRARLEAGDVTTMQATPTTWRLLCDVGFGETPVPLKKLCGGEAISPELAERLLRTGGELWNLYGPTETTVWSTAAKVEAGERPITIGRPIDHTQIYLCDETGALVPPGEVGELCIGGRGLARGYLGRDELTRERFVTSPHAPPGERIYRTGDLARWLPHGGLECLGRIDHQVKIRGFRIELGEIESCLRGTPGVREAVVVAYTPEGGDPRLVAYFVGPDAELADLEARVGASLPAYMHPAAFVRLAELPLNTNGKIDRNRLPPPSPERLEHAAGRAPASDAETRMLALFVERLGLADAPVDRDFFSLGGDSVAAVQLRLRIHEEFGALLPMAALFDTPTVERLVAQLGARAQTTAPLVVELRKGPAEVPPLLCLMGVTLFRELARGLGDPRSVFGLHIPWPIAGAPPELEEIAAAYARLILERFPVGPYHLAGLCFGGVLAAEVARQLAAGGHEVGALVLLDAPLPRGLRYERQRHLRTLAERLGRDPRGSLGRLRGKLRERLERVRSRPGGPTAPVELEATGPIADDIIARYDARATPLPVALTVFRATEREEPPWVRVSADLGWAALSPRVTIEAIEGGHLSILQAPAVARLARSVTELLRRPQIIS